MMSQQTEESPQGLPPDTPSRTPQGGRVAPVRSGGFTFERGMEVLRGMMSGRGAWPYTEDTFTAPLAPFHRQHLLHRVVREARAAEERALTGRDPWRD